MKRFLLFLAAATLLLTACDETQETKINQVTVALVNSGSPFAQEGVKVQLKSAANATLYTALTDASGVASFELKADSYEASATAYRESSIYNASSSAINVVDGGENAFTIEMVSSNTSQVIIKELYVGGCAGNNGKPYFYDSYVTLYNNSPAEADISNMAMGIVCPTNAHANNPFLKDGSLSYLSEGWLPCQYAVWWFNTEVKVPAYSEIVVAIYGGIDHSATCDNSVDLSKADYVLYAPEIFNKANYYPAPDASIPESHYLNTYKYGLGNAWAISNNSPAFVIFTPEGTTAEAFSKTPENVMTPSTDAFKCLKVPASWINDGVELYSSANLAKSSKRLTSEVDAGYVVYTNYLGYTVYRNVDKEATEALEENQGKIVTGYTIGTQDEESGSTDPSGIDAEASIVAGAHIIYKDTNNSSVDFHQRRVSALRLIK